MFFFPLQDTMSLCYMTLKICLHPRIPSCIRLACWNETVLPLSLRNISNSKKRARKERTGQLSIIGMMRPCEYRIWSWSLVWLSRMLTESHSAKSNLKLYCVNPPSVFLIKFFNPGCKCWGGKATSCLQILKVGKRWKENPVLSLKAPSFWVPFSSIAG